MSGGHSTPALRMCSTGSTGSTSTSAPAVACTSPGGVITSSPSCATNDSGAADGYAESHEFVRPVMPVARPRIALKLLGEEVVAEADVPADRGRLDELLSFMLALDQAAIDVAVRKNPSGKSVSCAKGCSACCRAQPVPVTPPEAYALWKLVESLPASRRD